MIVVLAVHELLIPNGSGGWFQVGVVVAVGSGHLSFLILEVLAQLNVTVVVGLRVFLQPGIETVHLALIEDVQINPDRHDRLDKDRRVGGGLPDKIQKLRHRLRRRLHIRTGQVIAAQGDNQHLRIFRFQQFWQGGEVAFVN